MALKIVIGLMACITLVIGSPAGSRYEDDPHRIIRVGESTTEIRFVKKDEDPASKTVFMFG